MASHLDGRLCNAEMRLKVSFSLFWLLEYARLFQNPEFGSMPLVHCTHMAIFFARNSPFKILKSLKKWAILVTCHNSIKGTLIQDDISFTYILNNNGPSAEP
jgi:hypothetical protein